MKNMMLQAKSFSKFFLCALLLMAAGCKKECTGEIAAIG